MPPASQVRRAWRKRAIALVCRLPQRQCRRSLRPPQIVPPRRPPLRRPQQCLLYRVVASSTPRERPRNAPSIRLVRATTAAEASLARISATRRPVAARSAPLPRRRPRASVVMSMAVAAPLCVPSNCSGTSCVRTHSSMETETGALHVPLNATRHRRPPHPSGHTLHRCRPATVAGALIPHTRCVPMMDAASGVARVGLVAHPRSAVRPRRCPGNRCLSTRHGSRGQRS